MPLTTEELALYIGSHCLAKVPELETLQLLIIDCDMLSTDGKKYFTNVKPFLRPVSNMTDEEFREVVLLYWGISFDSKQIKRIERRAEVKQPSEFGTSIPYTVYGTTDKDGAGDEQHLFSTTFSSKSLNPEQFMYLLSKQIDLFGWIGRDLAIDKTKSSIFS